jgi:hypothetical protein
MQKVYDSSPSTADRYMMDEMAGMAAEQWNATISIVG